MATMSNYTPKPNTGTLFKNTKKTTDAQPDYYGSLLVGSKEMRLAAWVKDGKKGKYMSISLSELRPDAAAGSTSTAPSTPDTPDTDLPF